MQYVPIYLWASSNSRLLVPTGMRCFHFTAFSLYKPIAVVWFYALFTNCSILNCHLKERIPDSNADHSAKQIYNLLEMVAADSKSSKHSSAAFHAQRYTNVRWLFLTSKKCPTTYLNIGSQSFPAFSPDHSHSPPGPVPPCSAHPAPFALAVVVPPHVRALPP